MDITQDSKVTAQNQPDPAGGRRADVEAKQLAMSKLTQEAGCDSLLILRPENFAWLTAGASSSGTLHQSAHPCLFFQGDNRWVVCGSADTQRIFDDEIDGLGFQVKEWQWHWGRDKYLVELLQGRNLACDQAFGTAKVVSDQLRKLRCRLTEYEQDCLMSLGQIASHALEASCRTMVKGDTEREVASQLSHRLLHRGAVPVLLSVAGDSRRRDYRQPSFTATSIQENCTLLVVARKYGLCVLASRSMCFGQPDTQFRREHDAACKVSATYIASSWPDAVPRQILMAGRRIFQLIGFEHEWLLAPQGHITGWASVEKQLTPQSEELLENHSAVSWHVSIGAALSADTFLLSEEGPALVTPIENWPVKRIRIQGAEFLRPDLLVR
jgi:Xaa-Pro dipeptidase